MSALDSICKGCNPRTHNCGNCEVAKLLHNVVSRDELGERDWRFISKW